MNNLSISSILEGIFSNIEIINTESLEQINVSFYLSAHQREDVPVIYNLSKAEWETIHIIFYLKNWDHYNFNNIPCVFEIISSSVLENIGVIFSIIRQPQSFDSYVMQKLYCVTTEITSTGIELQNWNVSPNNQVWYLSLNADVVTLYNSLEDMVASTNSVAEGVIDANLEVILYLTNGIDQMDYYYQDVAYHLTVSELGAGLSQFKIKPLTDMSEIRDPIYNNSNITLSRGEAELNLHTYSVLGKDITLAVHFPEMEVGEGIQFTSIRRNSTKIGQILSHIISGTLNNGEAVLINTVKTAEYMELTR